MIFLLFNLRLYQLAIVLPQIHLPVNMNTLMKKKN